MLSNPRAKWYAGHMGPNRWVVFPYSSLVIQSKFGKYFYSVIGPLKTQKDAEGVVRRMGGVLIVVRSVRELDTLPERNPGAGWHRTEEFRSQQRESDSIRLGRRDLESFYRGSKMAHRESRLESERLGENPPQFIGRSPHKFEYIKTEYGNVNAKKEAIRLERESNRLVQIISGKKDKHGFPYHLYLKRLPSKNPVVKGTKIYDKIQAIEAQKGEDSLWPSENFRHDFKDGGEIFGLENGDLLIKKKKKKLWKNFDYD